MDRNVLIKIKYDGTNFFGWQKQPDVRTVQGEIEHVLKFLAGHEVMISGTSRTDRGVHALGQCASFMWDSTLPIDRLSMILNKRFGAGGIGRSGAPGDIEIVSAEEVDKDFHARYSCVGKTYRYIIDRSGDIFKRNYVYQLSDRLNVGLMKEAAQYIIGTHDFMSFEASGGTPRETTVRSIKNIKIIENEDSSQISIEVTGDGFLYNMVRIMVGTLVEVGRGNKRPLDLPEIIEAKDRSMAGFTAPPEGLYLKQIYFDQEEYNNI